MNVRCTKSKLEFVAGVAKQELQGHVRHRGQSAQKTGLFNAKVEHTLKVGGNVHQQEHAREEIGKGVDPHNPDESICQDGLIIGNISREWQ